MQNLLLEEMMERPNFVRKSMPSKGVVTAANEKSNSKICLEKQIENWRNPQAGIVFAIALRVCADYRLGIDFPFFWVLKSSCSQSNRRAIA
jgi:hypothetical protein